MATSQPALLKPSDVTKPLLVTPSEYCGNKGKEYGLLRDVSPKAIPRVNSTATFDDHVKESSSRQQSQRTSPRIQQHALMCHTVNEQPFSAAEGVSNCEWLPKDERVSKDEHESRHNLEPIIPDVLKQLILSESKLKQNGKILKEFEEQRVIMHMTSCVENPVELFKPLPLNRECTNQLDEGTNPLDGYGSEQLDCDHKTLSKGDESDENCKEGSVRSMQYTNTKTPITNEAPKTEEDPISEVVKACTIRHQQTDTSNDAAIAAALQEELRKDQIKQQSASKYSTSHDPVDAAPQVKKYVLHEVKDYKLALQIQEEFDEEMASIIQTEEKQSYDRMMDPSGQTYRSQPHPVQGYSLRSGASVGYCSMHQQQPDRELDRERRVLYLNRNGQQKTIGAEGFERSDSIGLSYEELYELKDVPHGYSSGMIEKSSSTFRFTNEILRSHSESEHKKCLICLTDYSVGDNLRRLHCWHSFHTLCIDTWLSERKTCPICLTDIM